VTPVTEEKLSYSILDQYERLGSWAEVGRFYGISRTIVWRIVNDGYMPRKKETRRALGLPEIITHQQLRDPQGRFSQKR
ncbi:MAG: hypothetical protein ACC700_19865, partial [Anaerolineales bacterium]